MPGGPVVIAEQDDAVRHRDRDVAPQHVGHRGGGKAKHAVDRLARDPDSGFIASLRTQRHDCPTEQATGKDRARAVSTWRTHRLQMSCTWPGCA